MYTDIEYFEIDEWHDGMDFEAVVSQGLEEEDDMNESDAAFMRGFLGEPDRRQSHKDAGMTETTGWHDQDLGIAQE